MNQCVTATLLEMQGSLTRTSLTMSVHTVVLLLLVVSAINADRAPKEYVINLDLPPEQRWISVLKGEPHTIEYLERFFSDLFPKVLIPLVEKTIDQYRKYVPYPYVAEMQGMADYANVDMGLFLLPNLLYDITAFCTSIVAQDEKEQIWMGRNFDYGLDTLQVELLKNMSVTAHFQRGGQTVYSGVVILGTLAPVTAQKPHVFTFSMDKRDHNDAFGFLVNVLMALLDPQVRPTVFLVRDTLESATNFSDAVTRLSEAHTPSLSYMILGGVLPGEGAVITKRRVGSDDVWHLDVAAGRWYLVETNYDHWLPTPASDLRRQAAQRSMNQTGAAGVNKTSLYHILSKPPVLVGHTIFTTVMSAARPTLMETWIRD